MKVPLRFGRIGTGMYGGRAPRLRGFSVVIHTLPSCFRSTIILRLHLTRNSLPLALINNLIQMRKVFQWFVYSSMNPQVVSLTVKGLVPLLLLLGLDATESEALTDSISQSVMALGLVASSLLTLFGLVRKVYLSVR